jgi:hypothetical protein
MSRPLGFRFSDSIPARRVFILLAAWSFVALWYGLLQQLSEAAFGVRPGLEALWTDLLAHLMLGTLLLAMARGLGRFLLAWLALTAAFTLVNAAKVAILGAPVMPDDFLAARNLFRLLSGWQWLAALLTLALPLTLLGWMFAWRRPRAWASLGLFATLAVGLLLFPETASRALDARFGDWGWNQRGNFEARGLVAADPGLIAAYANSLYYKSRELMTFLAELRARDPQAVVVFFGDHLPYLGPNFRGYTDSGLLAAERTDFSDAMFRTLVATPLVVIDGVHGVVNTGDLPLYQLPGLLLTLLGDQRPSILGLTWPDLAADLGTTRLRPLPGLHFLRLDEEVIACRGDGTPHPACAATAERLEALRTLSRDLFAGEQHALLDIDAPAADAI